MGATQNLFERKPTSFAQKRTPFPSAAADQEASGFTPAAYLYIQALYIRSLSVPLSIRDPRAAALAKELARRRGTSMTAAIISALANEIRRDKEHEAAPLADRLAAIA